MKEVFSVNENYIMWGFRYALGRRTGAVSDVVNTLKRVWKDITPFTQDQIKQEIELAISRDEAGDECDIERWEEISQLGTRELTKDESKKLVSHILT